mmetsp:Transcript_3799/g.16104  ORF Transcript_3799/g.16104 Transcript_3799/m.16104 type:complete len:217 (-) Transcript_3799:90-740(-)
MDTDAAPDIFGGDEKRNASRVYKRGAENRRPSIVSSEKRDGAYILRGGGEGDASCGASNSGGSTREPDATQVPGVRRARRVCVNGRSEGRVFGPYKLPRAGHVRARAVFRCGRCAADKVGSGANDGWPTIERISVARPGRVLPGRRRAAQVPRDLAVDAHDPDLPRIRHGRVRRVGAGRIGRGIVRPGVRADSHRHHRRQVPARARTQLAVRVSHS